MPNGGHGPKAGCRRPRSWKREVKVFADGGDRCAITLPSRALDGLLSGAIRESWRLKGPGLTGHPFDPDIRIAQTWIAGQQAWPLQAGEHAP